jgi:hypothetical protein
MQTKLEQLKANLKSARQLAYNAAQMKNATQYGRLQKEIERLESQIDIEWMKTPQDTSDNEKSSINMTVYC